MEIPFDRSFDAEPGHIVEVAPGVQRIVAPNPGPFTFTGTNTYIVGRDRVAVIDPGPLDDVHHEAIEQALEGRVLSAVIVTHTHSDHSPLARPLADAHGATAYGHGARQAESGALQSENGAADASGDTRFIPDIALADGDAISEQGWRLYSVSTPGHASDHICLALEGTGLLFSGDHVMAWSTTVVAPPDGNMQAYMASLERLKSRDDRLYLPGHGGAVHEPQRFVRGLISHRRNREAAILRRVEAGDRTIPDIVAVLYQRIDPRLKRAAALSVLAHLEDLVARGRVVCDGVPSLDSTYRPA